MRMGVEPVLMQGEGQARPSGTAAGREKAKHSSSSAAWSLRSRRASLPPGSSERGGAWRSSRPSAWRRDSLMCECSVDPDVPPRRMAPLTPAPSPRTRHYRMRCGCASSTPRDSSSSSSTRRTMRLRGRTSVSCITSTAESRCRPIWSRTIREWRRCSQRSHEPNPTRSPLPSPGLLLPLPLHPVRH